MAKNKLGSEQSREDVLSRLTSFNSPAVENMYRGMLGAEKTKKKQMSIYVPEEQVKKLRYESYTQEKEKDQSTLIRVGIDIVLNLSADKYNEIKDKARNKGVSVGQYIADILQNKV